MDSETHFLPVLMGGLLLAVRPAVVARLCSKYSGPAIGNVVGREEWIYFNLLRQIWCVRSNVVLIQSDQPLEWLHVLVTRGRRAASSRDSSAPDRRLPRQAAARTKSGASEESFSTGLNLSPLSHGYPKRDRGKWSRFNGCFASKDMGFRAERNTSGRPIFDIRGMEPEAEPFGFARLIQAARLYPQTGRRWPGPRAGGINGGSTLVSAAPNRDQRRRPACVLSPTILQRASARRSALREKRRNSSAPVFDIRDSRCLPGPNIEGIVLPSCQIRSCAEMLGVHARRNWNSYGQ
jgi:hypothetical protein